MKHSMNSAFALPLALAAAFASTTPALSAQSEWTAFIGCWQPVGPVDAEAPEGLLCVTPTDGGVDMITFEDGSQVGTVAVIADGQSRAMDREGCTGMESSRFSADGRFLTTESDFDCEGDVRGHSERLVAMVNPNEWVEIELVEADDGELSAVRRYRAASARAVEAAGFQDLNQGRERAVRTARTAASSAPTLQDVVDVSAEADPRLVQAWVAEQGEPYRIDAEALLALSEAGVDEEVIDMVIAVSYPERFAIEQGMPEEYADADDDRYRTRKHLSFGWGGFGWSRWDRWGYSPYYGYNSFLGYGGYGYGRGYGSWGYSPTIVVVRPSNEVRSGNGRVVRGRGYTRGSTGTSSTARGSDRSSSGGSASAGSRSGSTSRSTGRKAKRRGG